MGSAQFDRKEDYWPRKWAEAYVDFAAGEMRPWLHGMGMRWFPIVGWAERGGSFANDHGNSVPRFHHHLGRRAGHGRAIREGGFVRTPSCRADRPEVPASLLANCITENNAVKGVSGEILVDDVKERGQSTSREIRGDFEIRAASVLVTSGGIGGNFDLVRKVWPRDRLGEPPREMIAGVPAHVDGRMMAITEAAGGRVINVDRMWHYTEGVKNWNPIWPNHGIRILPGPSSMWLDAEGNRLKPPCIPGFDTLSTLREILSTGYDYSWFIMTQKILKKEVALSGSEQNPDFASKSWLKVIRQRILNKQAIPAVEAFKRHGEDFIVANTLEELVEGMNRKGGGLVDLEKIRAQIVARDSQVANPFTKDAQLMAVHAARNYRGDRLMRTAKPHRFLDPENGPLIAIKLHIITRKTLGGFETDLNGQVLNGQGQRIEGLFAAGEVSGFGGGGYHGYNALEGSFLGGCIFSGRQAGRSEAIA